MTWCWAEIRTYNLPEKEADALRVTPQSRVMASVLNLDHARQAQRFKESIIFINLFCLDVAYLLSDKV